MEPALHISTTVLRGNKIEITAPDLKEGESVAVFVFPAEPGRAPHGSALEIIGARSLRSPEYLASVRRREAGSIADLVAALAEHVSDEHFAVRTQEPLDRIRRLIEELSHAEEDSDPEHEENSCEILRQLRDTFLDNGWRRYGEPAVRDAAVNVLKRLADAEEVSADDAVHAQDGLLDLGLKPTVGMAWSDEAEDGLPR
jgi:hypothetical protein